MMNCATSVAAGYRRYDIKFAAAEATAKRFEGFAKGIVPSQALSAFKRAANQLGAAPRLVQLVDLLFAWTKPQDWQPGSQPIVWPKNETLGEALGLEIRQVQNLLRHAIDLRLLSHVDSPNGHRGGKRDEHGKISWAFGIDLSPIGSRFPEFLQLAEAAALEAKARAALRRRMTIARKSIAQLAQTALEYRLDDIDWLLEVDMARLTASHARSCRDIERLAELVDQIEVRKRRVHAVFTAALDSFASSDALANAPVQFVDNACTDALECIDYRTTTHLHNSNSSVTEGCRKSSLVAGSGEPKTNSTVEKDLDRSGVDAAFIRKNCRSVAWQLDYGEPGWRDVIALAEDLASQAFVSSRTWSDACRIMGRRGAAAAMIAIMHKENTGVVRSVPPYLQGMINKAVRGELRLSRTFYAIRDESFVH